VRESINLKLADLLELSRDVLQKGQSIRFQAKGWSMRPFIRDGDFVTVSPVENSSIKTGDVVLYSTAENDPIMHRVIKKYIKKGGTTLLIKGDASSGSPERVDIQRVLGKLTAIERKGRRKQLDTRLYRIIGLLFAGISPFSPWTYRIGSSAKHSIRRLLGFCQISIPQ
jgi:signal peptidase I